MNIALTLAVMWKVTALDPSHVVVQADRTDDERAAFKVAPAVLQMGGWKYDGEVGMAAQKATADRPAFVAGLTNGTYSVGGEAVKAFGYWGTANGIMRFPVKPGKPEEPVPIVKPMYNVFLKLAKPMVSGKAYPITLPSGEKIDFTYDENVPTPLFKVNQVGYAADAAEKYVYLGGWMGPLGPYPRPKNGTKFELVDAKSGTVVLTGEPVCRKADDVYRDKSGTTTPYAGEETVEMDISAAKPGTYFVRIAGLGRSMNFSVGREGVGDLFALSMKGLFQQRCGCAKTKDLTHWTDDACHTKVYRGINPPEEWEYGWRYTDKDGKPFKTSHFAINNWQARQVEKAKAKGEVEELSLPGGWHDAADFDRRPMHMRIVGDLALLYLTKPENFTDDQIAIPEHGDGIPDVLNEAVWGLRHLFKGQQKDGGVGTWIETVRHPDEKNDHCVASTDPYPYFLSRATRHSSMDYAGYAALLARALQTVDSPKAKKAAELFKRSAERAWTYATTAAPAKHVAMRSGWAEKDEAECFYDEDPSPVAPYIIVKAAMNLYALTQDKKYADVFTADLAQKTIQEVNKRGWSMSAFILAESAITDIPSPEYEKVKKFWRERAVREADQALKWLESGYAYRLPYYPPDSGWVHTMSWGNVHPLHQAKKFIAAHMLTGDKKYLDASYLACDYHCGCNPNGETWTAGLGTVYPTSYLSLVSCADGIAEYVPGIPPYRNTFGLAPEVNKQIFNWNSKISSLYPILRRWGNMEGFSVGASEFTVWETLHDPAIVAGYLMGPGLKPKNDMREPAKDLRDLPGYWCLP